MTAPDPFGAMLTRLSALGDVKALDKPDAVLAVADEVGAALRDAPSAVLVYAHGAAMALHAAAKLAAADDVVEMRRALKASRRLLRAAAESERLAYLGRVAG